MTSYLIKAILASGLLLFGYRLLLEKGKLHRFKRIYLLLSLVLAFVIPLLNFTAYTPMLPITEAPITILADMVGTGSNDQAATPSTGNKDYLFLLLPYLAITGILLIRFIHNLRAILQKARRYPALPFADATIILLDQPVAPHSFLHYIFVHKAAYQNQQVENEILAHELTHVQQKHTYDVLAIEAVQAIFWFNPFIPFYKKAITLNHEFLADEAAIISYPNRGSYVQLLIANASKLPTTALTNPFSYLITKKRLIMITKSKSFKQAFWGQLGSILVLALAVVLFSNKVMAQDSTVVPMVKQTATPFTTEGVSQDLLNEYAQIVATVKNEKGKPVYSKFTTADKDRLLAIYLGMSKTQQAQQVVVFLPTPAALPKTKPTQQQFESWKNPKLYGVWINNKKVSNATLNQYGHADFSQAFVSRLAKNLAANRKYQYQVDLMTNAYYDNYVADSKKQKTRYILGIRVNGVAGRLVTNGQLVQ